jgi:hypothetical protein
MIYNAWWFEAIMGVLLLILLEISSCHQLLKKKNGPLSFAFVMDFIIGFEPRVY